MVFIDITIDNCSTTIIKVTIFFISQSPDNLIKRNRQRKKVWGVKPGVKPGLGLGRRPYGILGCPLNLKIELTVMIFVVELNFIPTEVSMSSIEFYIWSIHKCLFKITHRNYCRIHEKYHVSDPIYDPIVKHL